MDSAELSSLVLPQQKVQLLCLVPGPAVLSATVAPSAPRRLKEVGIRMEGVLEARGLRSHHGHQEPVGSRRVFQ